jgi:hypothetical protein
MKRKLAERTNIRAKKRPMLEKDALDLTTASNPYATHFVPQLLSKLALYYMNHINLDALVSILIGHTGFMGSAIIQCLSVGFPVGLHIDYVTKDTAHHRDQLSLSWTFEDDEEVASVLPKPLGCIDMMHLVERKKQIMAYVCTSIKSYLKTLFRIHYRTIEEVCFAGISLGSDSGFGNKTSQASAALTTRAWVLDFDISEQSPMRKEIGCTQSFTKYSNFDMLNTLLLYQIGCFWVVELIADFLMLKGIERHGTLSSTILHPEEGEEVYPFSPISGLRTFSRFFESQEFPERAPDNRGKFRFFFSGSKGIHVWLQNHISTTFEFNEDLAIFFNNRNPATFRQAVRYLIRWLISMCHKATHTTTCNEDDVLKLNILQRLNNLAELFRIIPFDMDHIKDAANVTSQRSNSSASNTTLPELSVPPLNTRSSIANSLSAIYTNLVMDTTIPPSPDTNVHSIQREHVGGYMLHTLALNDGKHHTATIFHNLHTTIKESILGFCNALYVFNPILVMDTGVNEKNHTIRMPFTYNSKSGMLSFELDLGTNGSGNTTQTTGRTDLSPKALTEQIRTKWTETKSLLVG